ncbi:MAG: tetratricopeptide repeat protein [Candidatus Melainabacteria bacterium]|nr:tetratricopeptide repeat protein [Candidatus Melainabacteria bacterium]
MPKTANNLKPLPRYQPGQAITGTIKAPDIGGYRLSVPEDPRHGFLPSDHVFQRGEKVNLTFISTDGERLLLTTSPDVELSTRPRMLRSLAPVKLLCDAYDAYEQGQYTKAYKLALSMSTDPGAQCLLGKLFEDGSGVERDLREAFDWYKLSAEQGVIEAQEKLATFYEHGTGTTRNVRESAKWRVLVNEARHY